MKTRLMESRLIVKLPAGDVKAMAVPRRVRRGDPREPRRITGLPFAVVLAVRSCRILPGELNHRGVRKVSELASGLTRNQESGTGNAEESGVFQIRGSDLGSPQQIQPSDPDLLAVAEKWPSLPSAVRAGIVAMVNAAVPDTAAREVARLASG